MKAIEKVLNGWADYEKDPGIPKERKRGSFRFPVA